KSTYSPLCQKPTLVSYSRFPIPDSRFPIPDSRFPIPDSRFPIPCSLSYCCICRRTSLITSVGT
ncbi:MAG: esterase, partial [Moorea sp. SIO2I5]|nr:esterase [Moorena sp. SIO2I5]